MNRQPTGPVKSTAAARPFAALAALCAACAAAAQPPPSPDLAWPPLTRECRPHAYWWWHGSAVDKANLTRELEALRAAGLGGAHVIPIYQTMGWENRAIPYLSPQWLEMLRHCVEEGRRLDLDIDMTTGSGWCFGGPRVADADANARLVHKVFGPGSDFAGRVDRAATQALVAFGPGGARHDLAASIADDGRYHWRAPAPGWQLHMVSQRPSGQRVKRAAPGGEGHMLNLFHRPGVERYLAWFTEAFAGYRGPLPRAMYHDSYEYSSDWSPDLFAQFEKRRGYRLQDELPCLLDGATGDHAARVRCDVRETFSDVMVAETLPLWAAWCRQRGILTRNEAHGSPGNLLDLYALADIPETEMFHRDRNVLVSKLASSAAHVAGRRLVAAETGTWIREHFTETLADLKFLLDDLFVSGVNHVFYHGCCYSPADAPWPGWLFYASCQMNPRNPVWHDAPALNAYAARCQAVLQHGAPDNDLLLYWPLHDTWTNTGPLEQKLTVHARAWFEEQPLGLAAKHLWERGFTFDYASDRQLAGASVEAGRLRVPGGTYAAVVVPRCRQVPLPTLASLLDLAGAGATVVFEAGLPRDVPGAGQLEQRRAALRELVASVNLQPAPGGAFQQASRGRGRVLAGDVEAALAAAGVAREALADAPGLRFIRRRSDAGRHYFLANRGDAAFDGWLPLATRATSVAVMDPLTGRTGVGESRQADGRTEVRLRLRPGESLVLRTLESRPITGPAWRVPRAAGEPVPLEGPWELRFLTGGPQLPPPARLDRPASWAALPGDDPPRFAGTAVYQTEFAAPGPPGAAYLLDLGRVCQSARVRLNGADLGTLLAPPFEAVVAGLKPAGNLLEVEVTSTAANRIRDLDRRKVPWRVFHDINFVNIDYQPFDAAAWPLADAGLLGPVTLAPLAPPPP